jgi:NAD-dependent DNA ligase
MDKKVVVSTDQALSKEIVLQLAIATLYRARIVKSAADAFIKSEDFSRETLAEDAELAFTELDDVWKALPLVEKCLRMEIPHIFNEMQDRLDEQFRLGKIAGLEHATKLVMEEALQVFMRGGKDSNAVALREAASHLQELLDAWRTALGLHWNTELAESIEETEARLAGKEKGDTHDD